MVLDERMFPLLVVTLMASFHCRQNLQQTHKQVISVRNCRASCWKKNKWKI